MTDPITSRNNPRIKLAAKLRDRRARREQQRIIIDGVREIGRALDAGVEFIEAFVCEAGINDDQLPRRLAEKGCDIVVVNQSVLDKIAFGDRSDGIVAVAKPPQKDLNSLTLQDEMLVAVLENVEKPGNIGAVLRSADAAGLSAVIVADAGTDLYNPNSIRASAGTIFSMPIVACSSEEALSWLRQHGFNVVATRVDGAVDYTNVSYSGRYAIVLGSEADGLSDAWEGNDITAVLLPMRGVGDSLNVSVTAAVLFYEALRQRASQR
ncbi:MAG TPA: RNA methyltransferase [Pirellulaceae bacterium]|nr:RNA methyltransferase [Pirellulaceae bacterium]